MTLLFVRYLGIWWIRLRWRIIIFARIGGSSREARIQYFNKHLLENNFVVSFETQDRKTMFIKEVVLDGKTNIIFTL